MWKDIKEGLLNMLLSAIVIAVFAIARAVGNWLSEPPKIRQA